MAALLLLLVVHQAGGDAGFGFEEPSPVEQGRLTLEAMRDRLRAVEHGQAEATGIGETLAAQCVESGRLAMAHQVESAEQWYALLKDAVESGDAAMTARLLERIAGARRDLDRRALELSACSPRLEPPRPVINRTWFWCTDAPPVVENPAWRSCERRRGAALSLGVEALLIAAPIAGLFTASTRGGGLEGVLDLGLGSAGGWLLGALPVAVIVTAVGLSATSAGDERRAERVGMAIAIGAAVGGGAGAITGMWLARPESGAAAPVAAGLTYLVLGGVSALLWAAIDHLGGVRTYEETNFVEATFGVAPVLMALSAIITVPAVWSAAARPRQ